MEKKLVYGYEYTAKQNMILYLTGMLGVLFMKPKKVQIEVDANDPKYKDWEPVKSEA